MFKYIKKRVILEKHLNNGEFFRYYVNTYGKERIKILEEKIRKIPDKNQILEFFEIEVRQWIKKLTFNEKLRISKEIDNQKNATE